MLQDLRFALRTFRKSPIFTAVALISLALGIGANTAIFTLTDQILLRLLPVKNPGELVLFKGSGPRQGFIESDDPAFAFSYPMYQDFRDRNRVFSSVLARFPVSLSLSVRGQTERVRGDLVSGNYFQTLGVNAALGRTFTPDDDRVPGGHPVAILSDGYWSRRFGRDAAILNQTIRLNGQPMTVVGITPPGFYGIEVGATPDVMVPMVMKAQMTPGWNYLDQRRSYWLNIMARLRPEVSRQQAQVAMNTLWRPILEMELQQMETRPERFRTRFLSQSLTLEPGQKGRSSVRDSFSAPLIVLMAMVGLVLLIACANVANLLIARAAARQKEIALRLALGASRARILRLLLVESLALSLGGGALGLLTAYWVGQALLKFVPPELGVRGLSAAPDLRALGFTLLISLATGIVFGLAPSLQFTRPALAATLKDLASSVSPGSGQVRLRKTLVVSQMALSLLLLIGAGLFMRSLYNLRKLHPGFRTVNLMTFSVDPLLNAYSQERIGAFYTQLRDNLAALPGVRGVTMAQEPLLADSTDISSMTVEGFDAKEGTDMNPHNNSVGAGYFATLGMPLAAGRDFTSRDTSQSPKVAVINEAMARYFFEGQNPLGRHIGFRRRGRQPDIEIVGIAKDAKYDSLREELPRFVYLPYTQQEQMGRMTFYVRTSSDPASTSRALRSEVQHLDPDLPVFAMKTMETQIDESLLTERLVATLAAAFGGLATLLAAVGLYGLMAYTVARRTREIGIRMALGAGRADVMRLVMREVALLAGIGILIGLPAALVLSRLIAAQLYSVTANDPLIPVLATVALAIVILAAGYIPASRATRVDPVTALRCE